MSADPSPTDPRSVTELLERARGGDQGAEDAVLEVAYTELRSLAAGVFSRERAGHTLQPTALVSEAWLRLAPHLDRVQDRVHFFALASGTMRRVLIDHERQRSRQKRGGDWARITLDDHLGSARPEGIDFVELNDLLERLSALNARHARVVELRIFGGLTIAESAQVLGVSDTTIETDWFTAKSWLRAELKPTG